MLIEEKVANEVFRANGSETKQIIQAKKIERLDFICECDLTLALSLSHVEYGRKWLLAYGKREETSINPEISRISQLLRRKIGS